MTFKYDIILKRICIKHSKNAIIIKKRVLTFDLWYKHFQYYNLSQILIINIKLTLRFEQSLGVRSDATVPNIVG